MSLGGTARRELGSRRLESIGRASTVAVFVVVLVVAMVNRLLPVLRGGGLSGVLGYDDAVYYAGAVGLVHGRVPYQDFLFLHPPGVLLSLAPVATLGRWMGETTGWEMSRLVWMTLGCLTSLVVASLLLPVGRLAAAVGGCTYAVSPAAVLVERTTLVEGLTNLCLAVALALVIRALVSISGGVGAADSTTLLVLAAVGAILGFSTAVKIWGVVPLVVIWAYVTARAGARWGLAVAAGAAATITVVCLPFFLAAPREMWRMVVLDQIGRDHDAGLAVRTAQIATLGRISDSGIGYVAAIAILTALAVGSVLTWRVERYRVVVPVLASVIGLLLLSPIFYPHYVAILAVPAAVMLGVVTGVVACRAALAPPAAPTRLGWRVALAVVGCLVLVLDLVAVTRIKSGDAVPTELRDPVRSAPGCLTSDDPNNLLALGVVGRNIQRDCVLVIDLGGHSHDLSRGHTIPRSRNAAWQRLVVDYLGTGHYALATRFDRGRGLSAPTATEIESWPIVLRVGDYELRQPPR